MQRGAALLKTAAFLLLTAINNGFLGFPHGDTETQPLHGDTYFLQCLL